MARPPPLSNFVCMYILEREIPTTCNFEVFCTFPPLQFHKHWHYYKDRLLSVTSHIDSYTFTSLSHSKHYNCNKIWSVKHCLPTRVKVSRWGMNAPLTYIVHYLLVVRLGINASVQGWSINFNQHFLVAWYQVAFPSLATAAPCQSSNHKLQISYHNTGTFEHINNNRRIQRHQWRPMSLNLWRPLIICIM